MGSHFMMEQKLAINVTATLNYAIEFEMIY